MVHEKQDLLHENQATVLCSAELAIDMACPNSMTSTDTFRLFLEENQLSECSLKTEVIDKKFRFGPSELYDSKIKVEVPIKIQLESGSFKILYINMFVLECKELPFLCGKDTLQNWNILMCMRDGKMSFIDDSFYFLQESGLLSGKVLIQVKDFIMAGMDKFFGLMLQILSNESNMIMIERNKCFMNG
jgi:hypothetical protein